MTFKIQVLSDTHNQEYSLSEEADLICHVGDHSNGLKGVYELVNKCTKINTPYITVLGNHPLYHRYIEDVYKELDDNNINYLTAGKEFKFQDKVFVGGNLWSNFRFNKIGYSDPIQFDKNKEFAEFYVNDFNCIYYKNKLITADDYHTLFNEDWNWIQKYKDRGDVIVMTHFPPHLACLDPYWGNHPTASVLNPYFINDLDVSGYKLWLTGHSHTCMDEVVDGCRIVLNARGYPHEEGGNGYRKSLLIEIK